MSYQIIVQFKNKESAEEFCGQMSDGFGENYCNFSHHRQLEGTEGNKPEHYVKDVGDCGRKIFYVKHIEGFDEEEEE